jgi:lipopolysaccharide transport system permease protein
MTETESLPHVTVIDAARRAASVSPRELLRHRDLWLILSQRDVKVRYRQALIGMAWAVLRPAASVAAFVMLFGWLDRQPTTEGVPYAASALAGLLTWQLFAGGVSDMADSLVRNRHVLTKVYFPRVLIPLSSLTVSLVDFGVALLAALGWLAWLGVLPGARVVLLPVWVAGVVGLAAAVGLFASSLQARYRDVGLVIPFVLQLGWIVHPVVYETRAVIPERYWWLYALNPLAVLFDAVRWSLVGSAAPAWWSVGWSALAVGLVLMLAWRFFHWLDTELADRI